MRISVDDAREYFAHPSQQLFGITPETLPGEPFEYWADGPICGIFHAAPWPNVWMLHHAAKPEGWGRLVPHAKAVLREFWDAKKPHRIIGWTEEKNRLAVAFSRRCGFVEDGRMPLPDGCLVLSGWRPECLSEQ